MNTVERDRLSYELAHKFLLGLAIPGVTPELLNSYLNPEHLPEKADEIPELYHRMLESAQNANMRSGVIGKAIGGVKNLSHVLFEFDPGKVLSHYRNWEHLLDTVVKELNPRGKIRRTNRSIWPRFCQTILSAARFLSRFASADDFHDWVRFFDQDDRARPALPMLLEREIAGLGFTLSCDFLKEIGYLNFAKPDVHIKDIFEGLKLVESRNDYDVFRAVVRVAESVNESPFCVDKVFWLIGSGSFHEHPEIGKDGRIGSQKRRFLEFATPRLM